MILGAQLTSPSLLDPKQRFPLGSARTARRSNAALSRRARRSSLGPSAATATKPSRRSWEAAWRSGTLQDQWVNYGLLSWGASNQTWPVGKQ